MIIEINEFDEEEIGFWYSDENRPFLKIFVDKMIVYDEKVEIFSRDYDYPIATIVEYDFWKTIEI
jgi:hypothetical protein